MTPLAIYRSVTDERVHDLVDDQLLWDRKILRSTSPEVSSVGKQVVFATSLVGNLKSTSYRDPFSIDQYGVVEPRKFVSYITPPPDCGVISEIQGGLLNPLAHLCLHMWHDKKISIDVFKSAGSFEGVESAKAVNEFLSSLRDGIQRSRALFEYKCLCDKTKASYKQAEKLLSAICARRNYMFVARNDLYMGLDNGVDIDRAIYTVQSFFDRLSKTGNGCLSACIYQAQLCNGNEVSFHVWIVWESSGMTSDWVYQLVSSEWGVATGNRGTVATCEYHDNDSKRLGIGYVTGDDTFYSVLYGLAHQAKLGEYFAVSSALYCKRYR